MKTYDVAAHWDADAGVWWAESEQIPGLATEAATLEQLDENVRVIAPDLLRLNLGEDGLFGIKPIRDPA